MYGTCTLHAEGFLHYYGVQTPSTNSFVYTIIGVTPTKSEVHMYPYIIIIIIRTEYVYVYICTVLFAGGPISGSANVTVIVRSYFGYNHKKKSYPNPK